MQTSLERMSELTLQRKRAPEKINRSDKGLNCMLDGRALGEQI